MAARRVTKARRAAAGKAGSQFVPVANLEELVESLPEVMAVVDKTADRIAARTRRGSKMNRKYPARYGPVVVTSEGRTRTVAAQGPLAHLDEWGSVNNPPRATMRRAAAAEGRFEVGDAHRESRSGTKRGMAQARAARRAGL